MTDEELFLKEGAEYFGNRLIYRGKDVGVTAPGAVLVLLAEGEVEIARLKDIVDVVAKPSKRAQKAQVVENSDAIDDLLG